jgi:hypothetical protein
MKVIWKENGREWGENEREREIMREKGENGREWEWERMGENENGRENGREWEWERMGENGREW